MTESTPFVKASRSAVILVSDVDDLSRLIIPSSGMFSLLP
nr:MAG TPA: hypothetical protein [Caudoviricetes sp.]